MSEIVKTPIVIQRHKKSKSFYLSSNSKRIEINNFIEENFLREETLFETDQIYFVEDGTVEFANNNLLILTSTAKLMSSIDKKSLEDLINEAEEKINDSEISDKERYLLSYKIDTLKNINL